MSYWLAEKKTFDGRRCDSCGFELRYDIKKPIYNKYYLKKKKSI